MERSVLYWVKAAWQEPNIAQDELPYRSLQKALKKLVDRWDRNFSRTAGKLAEYFAKGASRRTDAALKKILKDAGLSVELKLTAAQRDVMGATIAENVALIKSIPAHSLTQVEGIVQRSVTAGRDLGEVSAELRKQFGMTRRRAALIARDQNNKATAAFTRVRQQEAGIEYAQWVHSGGGREPRRTHLKAGQDKVRSR